MRALAVSLIVLAAFALADTLVFRFLFFALPNETAWETEPFYNFEWQMHRLRNKPAGEFRIVIAGSSLGLYGFLPEQMERDLADAVPGKNVRVYVVGHQGMHGLELAALSERYAALSPDLVILPVNMVDLRLERPILMNLMEQLSGPDRPAALGLLRRDLASMYAVMPLTGEGLIEAAGDRLDVLEKGKVYLGAFCAGCRLKPFVRPPLDTLLDNRFSRGHTYERYAGIDVLSGDRAGVTQRGHVPSSFSMTVTPELIRTGLELEIFADEAEIRLESGGREKRETRGRGWKNIPLLGFAEPGAVLKVQIAPDVPFDLYADRYAARLARNAGLGTPQRHGARPLRREDDLYEHMSDAEYKDSFEKRNYAFSKPGWEYLRALYDAKRIWAGRNFDPGLPAVEGIAVFAGRMQEHSDLLVVNSPENPLTLSLYENSPYYRQCTAFLSGLVPRGRMMDAAKIFPMQKFYDYHHLTWYGASAFSKITAEYISREFRSRRR